jgi:NAD(P)-dependent dehydrogenase (short-subunit alcohol dehydrogenase family)
VGRAHALLLASRGARIVVADHGVGIDGTGSCSGPAEDVVREITEAGGQAVSCGASVADERGAAGIVDTAIEAFGRLDVVVNNAGIHDAALFDQLTIAQYQRMLDVHFFGSLYIARAAWPHFVAAGYGRIVNTVSEAMLGGIPELTSYASAKGAVLGLTRSLAAEGVPFGIRVNAVAPRAYTRMSASHQDALAELFGMPQDVLDQINASMPPELCAPAAAFLAHESCELTGEILLAGMGSVARLAVVRSQGIWRSAPTPEDIAENLGTIMDLTDAYVTEATRSAL